MPPLIGHIELGGPAVIQEIENLEEWLKAGGVGVAYFTAPWCHPCKAVAKALISLAPQFNGRVEFGKVDINARPEIAKLSRVLSVPTVILFQDGKELERYVGPLNSAKLKKKLETMTL